MSELGLQEVVRVLKSITGILHMLIMASGVSQIMFLFFTP